MANEPRRGRWLPLVYYYLATIVGLVILLVGLIGGLNGLVQAAFPKASDELAYFDATEYDREGNPIEVTIKEKAEREAEAIERARLAGFAGALRGLVAAIVGAPVFIWHLRQARRREPEWLGLAT